jgi:hypothetical protein
MFFINDNIIKVCDACVSSQLEIEEEKLKMQNEKNRRMMEAAREAAQVKKHHYASDPKWKVRRPVEDSSQKTGKLVAEKENIPKKAPIKVIFRENMTNSFCTWDYCFFSHLLCLLCMYMKLCCTIPL